MARNDLMKGIPHSEIFEYWKDKAILENGEVVSIKEALQTGEKCIAVVEDWGEPSCWACGKPFVGDYEKNRGAEVDFSLLWNDRKVKSRLHKWHIVPLTKGGENIPRNMFLMCASCRDKAHSTLDPRNFLKLVYEMRTTHSMGLLTDELNCLIQQEILEVDV